MIVSLRVPRVALVLVAAVLTQVTGAAMALAQEPPPPPPAITLSPPVSDLGVQKPGATQEIVLQLHNGTDHVIFIEDIVGGCVKCLEFRVEDKQVPAGETRKIHTTVHVDTRGSGNFRVKVTLTDRDVPEVEAWVRYAVIPVLDPTPPALDFGDLVVGEKVEEVVRVVCTVPRAWKALELKPVLSGTGPVRLEAGELVRTPFTELLDQAEMTVTLTAKGVRQDLEGFRMELVFPEDPSVELRVPIQGRVVTQRFLQRNRFHLGPMKVGDVRKKTYQIPYATDQEEVVIEEVTTNLETLRATAQLDLKTREVSLSVQFHAREPGDVRGLVRIKTNLREQPYVVILGGKVRKGRD